MNRDDILALIRQEIKRNYTSGVPEIPPHQHDGVDNLQLNPINFLGYPVFRVTDANVEPVDMPITGIFRFQFDGTDFTMWFRNGTVWNQIGGGGGGTPAGVDTDVQFNDNGVFGGEDTFQFDKITNVLKLDDGSGDSSAGSIITGGTSNINIETDDKNDDNPGWVNLTAGDSTGTGATGGDVNISAGDSDNDGIPGNVIIDAGVCGSFGSPGENDGGAIHLIGGATGEATGGDILISSGSATTSGVGGKVQITIGGTDSGTRQFLQVRQTDPNGTVQPNVGFGSTLSFAGGQGCLYIRNRTTAPAGAVSSGGILYVESGALHFLGSSGTDTTIAPA